LSNNPYLGALPEAEKIVEEFVAFNPGTPDASPYMRATTVEAVLGAVYCDCGGDPVILSKVVRAVGLEVDS